jgi:hypothetical protein
MHSYDYARLRVADPHHFNVDPDPAFHFGANPYPDPVFNIHVDPVRIRIVLLLLVKVMGIGHPTTGL